MGCLLGLIQLAFWLVEIFIVIALCFVVLMLLLAIVTPIVVVVSIIFLIVAIFNSSALDSLGSFFDWLRGIFRSLFSSVFHRIGRSKRR